jgi:hypothetical protein
VMKFSGSSVVVFAPDPAGPQGPFRIPPGDGQQDTICVVNKSRCAVAIRFGSSSVQATAGDFILEALTSWHTWPLIAGDFFSIQVLGQPFPETTPIAPQLDAAGTFLPMELKIYVGNGA